MFMNVYLIQRRGPQKVAIFFHTLSVWTGALQGSIKNETDFTKMFLEFLGIKIWLQFLCSC